MRWDGRTMASMLDFCLCGPASLVFGRVACGLPFWLQTLKEALTQFQYPRAASFVSGSVEESPKEAIWVGRCTLKFWRVNGTGSFWSAVADLFVFSRGVVQHVGHLEEVLTARLRWKLKKCKLFQAKVAYLGHMVSEEGIADPLKVQV